MLLAEAIGVDTENHRVVLSDGSVDYDTLIVATGASHQYFGHDDWEKFAPGLKTSTTPRTCAAAFFWRSKRPSANLTRKSSAPG